MRSPISCLSALLLMLLAAIRVSAQGASESVPDVCETDSLEADSLFILDMDEGQAGLVRKKGKVLVIGSGARMRGCNPFGYRRSGLEAYAGVVNEYQDSFPDVKVYCLAIPTAIEFYLPEGARNQAASQRKAIDILLGALDKRVVRADSYDALQAHVSEPIYSRTDHHWAPLGAYYAAQLLAQTAGVPFRELDSYYKKVVRNYVGTMYTFSHYAAFKSAPENFVYYMPKDATYKTIYVNYTLDKSRKRVVEESEPYQDKFFREYKDGSSAAYCTFMGGDTKLTRVETDVDNGRRVLLLKDSFGNALSSFLFYSFEQVHVVDCRYFTQNLMDYVREHDITDIVFANNIAHTSAETVAMYRRYLVQGRSTTADEVDNNNESEFTLQTE